jgi:putative PIN family toxin of toxin-antitoxin system
MSDTDKRFVLDTNLIVSAMLFSQSLPSQALAHTIKTGQLLQSNETALELTTVVQRSKFDKYVPLERRLFFLNDLLAHAQFVVVSSQFNVCRDPKDNKFLDLAVDGLATSIITGDQDLLVLHPFENIAILTASDFLAKY